MVNVRNVNTDLALLYKLYKLSFLYSKANQHRINDKSINNLKNVIRLFLISKNISLFFGFFYYYLKRIIYNGF